MEACAVGDSYLLIRQLLSEFADLFEEKFINQDYHEDRSIFESLDIGWELVSIFDDPYRVLKRIPSEYIDKFHPEKRDKNADFNSVDI